MNRAKGREAAAHILAIGDSWQYVGLTHSLGTALTALGYRVHADESDNLCENGKTLRALASHDLDELTAYVANMDGAPGAPAAVLLSSGGNDLAQRNARDCRATTLYSLLRHGAASAEEALHIDRVEAFIDDELTMHYRTVLSALTGATGVPILVHGYDHPVPDGRKMGIPFGPGPWLKPVFDAARIVPDLPVRCEVMRDLIDRLNSMLQRVCAEFGEQVHHLNLAGVLARQEDYTVDHRRYWTDELHATERGFRVLAGEVQRKLESLGV